jgi:hypothetical protein
MRDLVNKTRRRATQQDWVTCSGLALAIVLIVVGLSPSPATAAPSPSTAHIQGLEVLEDDFGTKVEVATDGTPIWTTYRDSDGNLVVELASSLPADSVASLTRESGLLAEVEVQVERDTRPPMTRLVIRTRSDAEHSVIAEGPNLSIALAPVMAVAPAPEVRAVVAEVPAVEPAAPVAAPAPEPEPVTVSVPPPVAAVEPVPGPSGEPVGDLVASQLRTVDIGSDNGETTVHIVGDGEFYYSTLTLGAPDRFVVDLIGVVNMAPNTNIAVEGALVERVRVAQYKPYPEPVSRVVVDLRNPSATRIEATDDGLVLAFGEDAVAAYEAPPPPAPVEVAETPQLEPASVVAEEELTAGVEELVEEPSPAVEVAEVAAPEADDDWQTSTTEVAADEGMGSNETGTVGSHELSSLASAVATDNLEEELVAEEVMPEPVAYEPPAVQIAEARPEPEPAPYPVAQEEPAARELPASFESEAVGASETAYSGAPMTISLKDGDIKDVLRSFAQISGLNVVVQPGVTGTVTVELTDVPWDQALEQILKINGLGYELEGNIMRVAPISQLRAEAEEQQRLLEAQALSIPLTTMMKRISYAAAAEIAAILKAGGGASIMSARGSVVVDRRTNTLIIKELPDFMDTVMAVIENLDVPEPQVMIESRIIETTKRFSQSLGIQWNFGTPPVWSSRTTVRSRVV